MLPLLFWPPLGGVIIFITTNLNPFAERVSKCILTEHFEICSRALYYRLLTNSSRSKHTFARMLIENGWLI
jgi:hypothetical protein